ncbi:hypothetical protein HMPREF0307_02208 [Corynebacterium sp. DNF00584]|nr:hypothetical protein HMPREF0307_02208 [Corynebacterium sp. DNF00584]
MLAIVLATGSSPLTRGAQLTDLVKGESGGLIPAHAGSTWRMIARSGGIPAHPRSRGEHLVKLNELVAEIGSSPLTRGAPTPAKS